MLSLHQQTLQKVQELEAQKELYRDLQQVKIEGRGGKLY